MLTNPGMNTGFVALALLLAVASAGCRTQVHSPAPETRLSESEIHPPAAETPASRFDYVIAMPLGFAGSPELTPEEMATLEQRVSKQHFEVLAEVQVALTLGCKLAPVSHAFCSPVDSIGSAHPYTETVWVCRLT